MNLQSIFTAVAYKELVLVDLPNQGSNQHEINGAIALKQFFATTESISGPIQWHYFSDNSDPVHETGQFTFYDARAKSTARTGRSEWRLYYYGEFLSYANPGDALILLKTSDNRIFGLIFQKDSGWLRTARALFGVEEIQPKLSLLSEKALSQQNLEFARRVILEELGIPVEIPANIKDEDIATEELAKAQKNGLRFPSTQRMAELARASIDVDFQNLDATLVAWLSREEELFRAIEKIVVQEKLTAGFESVDDFIKYSLSVQNRRKARMGYALQNHLARLFTVCNVRYAAQAITEGKNKPDFLFPGKAEYDNPMFGAELLVMLGVKSSCKERWRQILTEAKRVTDKHLCTLEQAISIDQTDEMAQQRVTLVLPSQFHGTYKPQQREGILSISEFIEFVKAKQIQLHQ